MKNVHQAIKFNQKIWLKRYINMNTKLKQIAKNSFDQDFFNESCNFLKKYGKCEKIRKY